MAVGRPLNWMNFSNRFFGIFVDFQCCIGASLYEISHCNGCDVDSRRNVVDSWSLVMGKWWRLFLVCDGPNQCSARCPNFYCGRLPATGNEFHWCRNAGKPRMGNVLNENKNFIFSRLLLTAGFERCKAIVGLEKWPMHAKYNAWSTAFELIEWHPIGRRFDDK